MGGLQPNILLSSEIRPGRFIHSLLEKPHGWRAHHFSGHLFHALTALMVKKVFHIPRTPPSNSPWIDTDKRDLLKMQMWGEKGLFSYKCVGEEVFSIREDNNSLGLNENIFLRSRLAECHSQPPMTQLLLQVNLGSFFISR